MSKRKIVSVSVAGVANTMQTQCDFITTAVCDDGTVWQLFGHRDQWLLLPPIPDASTTATPQGAGEMT